MTRLLDVPQLLALEGERVEWIIPGLLAKPSKTLIVGGPKAGKSFLALSLALAISQGLPVLGRPCKRSKVLLLQFDTPHGMWVEMIGKVVECGVDVEGELYHVHPADLPQPHNILMPNMQEFIRSTLDTCEPDVVMLDVFRKIHTAGENDSQQMAVVDQIIEGLFKDVAFVLLHHSKKPFQDIEMGAIDASRGSSHIASIADFVWYVTRKKMHIVPRISEELCFGAKRAPSGLWVLDGKTEVDDLREKLLALCREHPSMSKNSIFEQRKRDILAMGIGRSKFFSLLEGVTTE